jgi:hypothetical protein
LKFRFIWASSLNGGSEQRYETQNSQKYTRGFCEADEEMLGPRAFETAKLQGNHQGTSVNEIMNLCFFFLILSFSMLIFNFAKYESSLMNLIQINI